MLLEMLMSLSAGGAHRADPDNFGIFDGATLSPPAVDADNVDAVAVDDDASVVDEAAVGIGGSSLVDMSMPEGALVGVTASSPLEEASSPAALMVEEEDALSRLLLEDDEEEARTRSSSVRLRLSFTKSDRLLAGKMRTKIMDQFENYTDFFYTLRQGGQEDFLGVPVGRGLGGHVGDVLKVVHGHVEDLRDQLELLLQGTSHLQVLSA